ncbi:hypothetical protein TcasGA2_TC012721 [Tribolium castaneum]|uniref:Uncharacterized protein n=1 Tax=Tribolium castaneum TaxID=7070 RepID=D6WZT3_TRICA|nr:hypothetical protein TcasGA2_TC012721 [Tribolium castaneum]
MGKITERSNNENLIILSFVLSIPIRFVVHPNRRNRICNIRNEIPSSKSIAFGHLIELGISVRSRRGRNRMIPFGIASSSGAPVRTDAARQAPVVMFGPLLPENRRRSKFSRNCVIVE